MGAFWAPLGELVASQNGAKMGAKRRLFLTSVLGRSWAVWGGSGGRFGPAWRVARGDLGGILGEFWVLKSSYELQREVRATQRRKEKRRAAK